MTGKTLTTLLMSLLVISVFGTSAMAQTAVSRMTKEELKARLDDPQLIVVDVRLGRDWYESNVKIKGAVRVEPRDAVSAATSYDTSHTLVFYCT